MFNSFDNSQERYSSSPPPAFPIFSTSDDDVSVIINHLARYDIQALKKLKLPESSNADGNKVRDDRERVLRERLALYFSTERGLDYDQKLRETVNPTVLFHTREDRYAIP